LLPQENALNEIARFENPQDVKAVSVQEENVKLKNIEQLIRDKAKRLTELTQQIKK
jgi:hypothetical protein